MYNPETYGWYQCDEENYDSNASPEEQLEAEAARKQYAAELIAAMRAAVAEVASYVERDLSNGEMNMDRCPKCDCEMTPEQVAQYHGCCSQECDEDEGIMIIVGLAPALVEPEK